jgi:sulfide:quinone oxidoreductase
MSSKIVILGAGIGGIVTARELKDRVGNKGDVTLIDRKPRFVFPPSLPWVVTGVRAPQRVERELSALKKHGLTIRQAEVNGLDLERKTVQTTDGLVAYDHLVIALGADLAPETIPGFSAHANHMYDLPSAVRMREAVDAFRGGTLAIGVSRLPFKCPAAPYEMAFLLDDTLRRRGLREKTKIEFFTPEGAPLPAAGPENGAKVTEMLHERGIGYQTKRRVKDVSPGLVTFEEGQPQPFDLLVCVPPHQAPKPVVSAGLTDASGWVPVDPRTLRTRQPEVYAVGDVAAVPTPRGYVPLLPKAGVFARGQASIVANHLAVQILGKGRVKEWDGFGACFLEVARSKSAFMSGNFLASPHPELEFRGPSAIYHTQKVLYEKRWFNHWF